MVVWVEVGILHVILYIKKIQISIKCIPKTLKYRPPALSQTRLSRKPHLCRIDLSLPSISPYMLLYFNLACVELGYDENLVVSK